MQHFSTRPETTRQVRTIIEELAAKEDLAPGSNEQKIRDLYASCMDKAARDAAGIRPIQPTLDRIAAIDSPAALIAAFGRADVEGSSSPVGISLGIDRKNPDRYLVGVGVGGLGLPDKDYYLNTDARFVAIRAAYVEHITRMLGFAGVSDGKARAEAILALETELAQKHWDRADRSERVHAQRHRTGIGDHRQDAAGGLARLPHLPHRAQQRADAQHRNRQDRLRLHRHRAVGTEDAA